jgi:hypothetical protein
MSKRYGKKNFDLDYLPIYNQYKINSQHNMKPQDICSHRINTFLKLSKLLSNDKFNLIVTRGENITLFNNWIDNKWNLNSFNVCSGLKLKLKFNHKIIILILYIFPIYIL